MKQIKWITKDVIHAFSLLGYLGLVMIGNIFVCIFIYKIIEKYLHYKSTLLFIGMVIIGVISGFYNVYKLIIKK